MLKGPDQKILFRHLLELIDRADPRHVALKSVSGNTSYAMLKQQYLTVGQKIAAHSPQRVAISMERDSLLIFSFLGCLHQGIPYLYIEPDLPLERKRELIRDADISLFVSSLNPGDLPIPLLILSPTNADPFSATFRSIPPHQVINEEAILVATSGTSGIGKCIRLHHQSLINNCLWRQKIIDIQPGDTVLHNIRFSFDPSLWQLYGSLAAGATVLLGPERIFHDLLFHLSLIQEHNVTITDFVPSVLRLILEEDATALKQLRVIFIGGEPLSSSLVNELLSTTSCRVFNQYGPAEVTIDATSYEVLPTLKEIPNEIPIGRPISNVTVHIVDEQRNELPQGEVGEICVGGMGVSLGYTRPQKQNGFIADFYLTGDLGVINHEGEVLFRGRMDEQIKISGQRVELFEIERAAEKVTRSPVCVKLVGEHQLGLFTEARCLGALRDALLKTLPAYMVPSRYFCVKYMPINASGKVSRKDLRVEDAREWTPYEGGADTQRNGEIESMVLAGFQQALGKGMLPKDVDFFALGGTSLQAIRLISQLKKTFAIDVDFKSLMNNFSIQSISAFLRCSVGQEIDTFKLKKTYPLSPLQVVPGLELDSQVINLVEFPAGTDIRRALHIMIAHHPILSGGIVACKNMLDFNSDPIIDAPILSDSESELLRTFPLGDRCFQAVLDGNRAVLSFKRMVYDARSIAVFEQDLSRALRGEPLQGCPDGFYRHLDKFGNDQLQPQRVVPRTYHHQHFAFSCNSTFLTLFKGIGLTYGPKHIAAPVLNRHTQDEENSIGRFVQLRSLESERGDAAIRHTFFGVETTDSDAFTAHTAQFFLNVMQCSGGLNRDGFTYCRVIRDQPFYEPFPNLVIAIERRHSTSVYGYLDASIDFRLLERHLKQ